ncbi:MULTISPECIES: cytochrome P450 [unclassified Pantoea]|uniref:cytochrome P450 n=1 Tax=unclassified Pantoea TaxID=2630326 RepID=UPI0023D9C442|nr:MULTISPECIES: cytochrome P450 [unclassified Pantoea]MDF2040438.1 cytochrome P450 [Pantoea sp. Cr_R14]MDF2068830.1 cytochrome P450 [Pantoea sp. Cr_R13]MDF2078037.1 cytochrome P450 [Pantoea sp. Cr_R21]
MQLQELMNPDYSDNPFPLYRKLHQQGPLIPAGDKIIISGSHAVVEALLNDRRVGKNYMESVRLRFGDDAADMPLFQGISRMFLVLNPPEHSRLKGLVMKSFSAREIKPLREMALTVANELVDALADRRACDLAQAFAFPLPVRIICRMLDISESDAPELGRLTSALVKVFDPQISQTDLLEAADAFAVLERYFSALIVSRRDSTANDLVSLFLRSGSEDDRLSHDEIIANVVLLFLAGHETTSNMICNTILALHDHPQELACLKQNPALIPNAIEECLRYDSSVQMLYRTTLEEIELAGQLIPTGTRFFLSLGAANHDPLVFTSPERVNIRRHEGRCLAFGGGIHHCMGYRLALAEMEVALHVLLTRLPELRPITAGVRRNHRANLRGVNALPVEW